MTDFVLEQEKSILNELSVSPVKDCDRLFVRRIISYQRFLKQPRALGMLIPCDEDGNILEKPKYYEFHKPSEKDIEYRQKYAEAKKRVLFKGFEYIGKDDYCYFIKFNELKTNDSRYNYTLIPIEGTIEDLIGLTINESAIKQFEL